MSKTTRGPADDGPEDYLIHLRPEGDGPPTAIRVRRLLKCALRAFGLRCVRVGPPDPPPDPSTNGRSRAGRPGREGER